MNVVVATDWRYYLDRDAAPCCYDGTHGYSFWSRYLEVFDSVTVAARLCRDIKTAGVPVEGDRVSLHPLENYLGPEQYLIRRRHLLRQIEDICRRKAAFLLRIPSQIGTLVCNHLRRRSYPYGVEVVGDPYDVFSRGACRHHLRSFVRWDHARRLRKQCSGAACAAYVTAECLQTRYPPARYAFTTNYSSVEMPEDAYATSSRSSDSFRRPARLVFVGSMSQLYKGVHVLIDAAARCVQKGISLSLSIIGDGNHQSEMEAHCREKGITECVEFLGRLPAGDHIRKKFDQSDLCVLPSLAEGLPRVLIEAMGRALPCIGSSVGGIPELLEARCLVPPGNAELLAAKIMEFLNSPQRLAMESKRNLQVARRYHTEQLTSRRNEFYSQLSVHTKNCLSGKAA